MKRPMFAATLAAALVLSVPVLADGRPHEDLGGYWQRLDTNKDGKVEKSEFDAERAARFKEADLNGDGKISFEEAEAAREKRMLERRKARFAALDRDGDGSLSEEEVNRLAERMWIRTDTNDDDVVTPDEMHRRGERMREAWQHRRDDRMHRGGDERMHRGGDDRCQRD